MPARKRRRTVRRRRRRIKNRRGLRWSRNYRRGRRRRPIRTLPKTQLVRLTYCDDIVIPNRDAGSAPYTFCLNSIHDPDITATGHQPRGHDQWAQMYKKYCVIAATARVEPMWGGSGGDGTDQQTTLYGYLDDDSTSDNYDVNDIIELGLAGKHKYINFGQAARSVKRGYNPTMKFKVGMKRFFGLTKKTQVIKASAIGHGDETGDTSTIASVFGYSPVSKCCLKLHCGHDSSYNNADSVIKAKVILTFTCVLYDPIEIGGS